MGSPSSRSARARPAAVAISLAAALGTGISWVLVGMIRAYQLLISPLLGPTCKYYPSCSSYAMQALRLRGPIVGLWLLASRLARCNPWSLGGVDDVPLPRAAGRARHRSRTPDRPTEQRSRSQNE